MEGIEDADSAASLAEERVTLEDMRSCFRIFAQIGMIMKWGLEKVSKV